MPVPKFAAGVIRFQKEVFPEKRELFETLQRGQSPEALFITCSDSRIETAMITQTGPGELFICRNAGNIVPPHSNATGGMTASIEFALAVLEVPHVVICGHTECGAMAAAMDVSTVQHLKHVRRWICYCEAAVNVVREVGGEMTEAERMRLLTEQNVVLQLRHLKTHPSVAARLARGDLELHGWVYDIKSGDFSAWDEARGVFEPVCEHYAPGKLTRRLHA